MSASGTSAADASAVARDDHPDDGYKWKAFASIAISFVTMVMSMSMVFVALSAIAEDFGVTLRAITWVVIAQALTISVLMMPMGRLADMIGRKKVHLTGLVLFGGGAILAALSPNFGTLILARVVMAAGNSMGQSVGMAMVVSVFPSTERGTAIGSQTTAVAVGGAAGPIIAGLVLQVMPWETLFWMLAVPIALAFVAGFFILDESRVSQLRRGARPGFDAVGAVVSAAVIMVLVIAINNPLGVAWTSPIMIASGAGFAILLSGFIAWELRIESPMLELRMFRNVTFSLAVATRLLGFMGTTATRFLMPIFLISFRGLNEGAAGMVLFLSALGLGLAAQSSGRLGDRFGERPFAVFGFVILIGTALGFAFVTGATPLWVVMATLFVNGLAMGFWNVPNSSVIMGSVPASRLGVVGALTNLTRNVGNVTGQAVASAVVVGVMVARGFDISLGEIADTPGAGEAFVEGWRAAYLLVTGFSVVGLVLSLLTNPGRGVREA